MPELTQDLKDLIRRQMEEIPLKGALLDQACNTFEKQTDRTGLNGAYGSDETKSSWQFKYNITRAAELLGIDKGEYIQKAALKQPSLFYQSPDTIKRNVDFIVDAHHRGSIRSDDLMRDILDYPVSLCCAPANTHLRAIHAFVAGKSFTLGSFFTSTGRNKTEITRELVKHYTEIFNRTGKGLKTLQTLARAKEYPPVEGRATSIIPQSTLPDWAQP